jgi:predicted CoA-binding protein
MAFLGPDECVAPDERVDVVRILVNADHVVDHVEQALAVHVRHRVVVVLHAQAQKLHANHTSYHQCPNHHNAGEWPVNQLESYLGS